MEFFRASKFNYVHSITPKAGLVSMMAARLCGVPISSHTCTGQVCLNKLLEKSFSIRLLTRSKKKIFPQGVDIFLGDLTLPDTDIEKFLIGGDVLINHAGETSNLNQM